MVDNMYDVYAMYERTHFFRRIEQVPPRMQRRSPQAIRSAISRGRLVMGGAGDAARSQILLFCLVLLNGCVVCFIRPKKDSFRLLRSMLDLLCLFVAYVLFKSMLDSLTLQGRLRKKLWGACFADSHE